MPVRRFEGGMNRQMRPDFTRDASADENRQEDAPETDSQGTAEETRNDARESDGA